MREEDRGKRRMRGGEREEEKDRKREGEVREGNRDRWRERGGEKREEKEREREEEEK